MGQINVILGQDMPIVFLGRAYSPLQMKENIATAVFDGIQVIEDRRWRYQMYRTYSIVHNVRIDAENALRWESFVHFIINNINKREKAELPRENPFENLVAPAEAYEVFGVEEVDESPEGADTSIG